MNRQIKFRAWDGNKMLKVGVLDISNNKAMDYYNWYDGYSGEIADLDKYPIMQFTGLTDKNGVDIYESDVNQDLGVLVWNQDDASFIWEYKDIEAQTMGAEHEWCIVIGNLYEHPHLIKTK